MRLLRTTTAAVSLAVIASLSACTSDAPANSSGSSSAATSDGARALSAALSNGLRNSTSSHFDITGTFAGSPVTGSGDLRIEKERLTGLQATVSLAQLGELAFVVDGNDRYVKLPAALATSSGKPWTKIGSGAGDAVTQQLGGVFDGAFGAADISALRKLVLGGAKSVRKVGSEPVSGVPATRYDVIIDPAKLPKGLGSALGKTDVSAKLWLDEQGRPLRVRLTTSVTGQAVDITFTLSRFGQPVTITPPPANQVATG